MVVVLPESGAIRVKIAFILGCLETTGVNFVRFFSTSLKSKSFASKGKPFSLSTIDCFLKNTFEIFI